MTLAGVYDSPMDSYLISSDDFMAYTSKCLKKTLHASRQIFGSGPGYDDQSRSVFFSRKSSEKRAKNNYYVGFGQTEPGFLTLHLGKYEG